MNSSGLVSESNGRKLAVERASGGRALRGVNLIGHNLVSPQFLLAEPPPGQVTLYKPTPSSRSATYHFSNSEESRAFCKDVEERGWTMAAKIHAGFLLFSGLPSPQISAGLDRTRQRGEATSSDRKLSGACTTECLYVPMGSFQIPYGHMMLSESAFNQALRIQDGRDADKFMKAYYPFVFLGMYHVGGVFFRQVETASSEETSLRNVSNQLPKNISGGAKVKLGLPGTRFADIFSVGVQGSYKSSNGHESSTEGKHSETSKKVVVSACGPTLARTTEEFHSALQSDSSSWAIIDKDENAEGNLMGVWELLLKHSEKTEGDNASALKGAARILCQRWIHLAERQVIKNDNIPNVTFNPGLYLELICNANHFLVRALERPKSLPHSNVKSQSSLPMYNHNEFRELEKAIQAHRAKLSEKYNSVFIELEKMVTEKQEDNRDSLFQLMEDNVKCVMDSATEEVTNMLKHEKWQKWEIEKLEQWKVTCIELKILYRKKIEELLCGISKLESDVAAKCESCCRSEVVKSIDDGKLEFGQGLDAPAMLIKDIQRALEAELQRQLKESAIIVIFQKIGFKEWMFDKRVLRYFMDCHLLHLMETKQITKVIHNVCNESNHYQKVTTSLIEMHVIKESPQVLVQKESEEILRKVEIICLELQTLQAKDTEMTLFLSKMKEKLERKVDGEFVRRVFSSIHLQDYYKAEQTLLDREFYEKKLPGLCANLRNMKLPSIQDIFPDIVKGIKKQIGDVTYYHCRPKCDVRCPGCGGACFHPKGHDLTTIKHDCIHQPAGLSGITRDKTGELVEKSCLQDFTEEFPDWKAPAINNSCRATVQVKECIFFNFQKQLVQFFRQGNQQGIKVLPCPCEKMPREYNHDLKRMHEELKNRLSNQNIDLDKMWDRISDNIE